jgi:hypothetical protein
MKKQPIPVNKSKKISIVFLKVNVTMQNNEVILQAPRSIIVFLFQYMAIIPICTAFGFILLPLLSTSPSNSYDIIILFLLILFFLLVGFAMLYFPQKQRTICVYDKKNNVLRKIQKNKNLLTCDLNGINKIILRINKKDIGVNIEVLLEKANDSIELYREHDYLSYKQWIVFANKLAGLTSLPLKEDFRM